LILTESVTNFVNDKSGLGFFLCKNIVDSYDNIQDAPKEKKISTAANDFIGGALSWMTTTPLACAATYGLATLGRLEGDNPLSKIVRTVCKPFNMGLGEEMKNAKTLHPLKYLAKVSGNAVKSVLNIARKQDAKLELSSLKIEEFFPRLRNTLAKNGGGIFRFVMIMFVFSALFKKPVDAIMQKIFGKPYNKGEEDRKKQLEEQGKQIIPELGITQNELMEKIQKNPHALDNVQNNPELTKKLQENPKLLLDLLDGKDINASKTTSDKKTGLSEANLNYINSKGKTKAAATDLNNSSNIGNTTNFFLNKDKNEQRQEEETSYDTATYIPSSAFTAKSSVSTDLQKEIDKAFKSSDKLLKKGEKLI